MLCHFSSAIDVAICAFRAITLRGFLRVAFCAAVRDSSRSCKTCGDCEDEELTTEKGRGGKGHAMISISLFCVLPVQCPAGFLRQLDPVLE